MAGLDHGPAQPDEPEDMELAAANARTGMVLFVIYFAVYAVYVGMAAFAYQTFATTTPLTGTLAIDYGMALIIGAMATAILYGWLCRANGMASRTPAKEGGSR
jgi:uncharacterized membrane protein (DUF485 family)